MFTKIAYLLKLLNLKVFAKIKGWGGGEGEIGIFPGQGVVLWCHKPNFRSLGQSLHIDNFCKNQEGGGRYYP